MKTLKQLLLMTFVMICLSMTAMAQKQDDKKDRPVKPDPPKIEPKDKPKDPPKDDNNSNRPKKPQDAIFVSGNKNENSLI